MRKLYNEALIRLGLRPTQGMPHVTMAYRVESSLSVPSENDMLAEFGLDPKVEEDASLTYVFRSPSGEEELSLNYSRHRPLLAVSMNVNGEELFSVEADGVATLRIVAERGAQWLAVTFQESRNYPKMLIHLEPRLKLLW